jgi:hypothetical protein
VFCVPFEVLIEREQPESFMLPFLAKCFAYLETPEVLQTQGTLLLLLLLLLLLFGFGDSFSFLLLSCSFCLSFGSVAPFLLSSNLLELLAESEVSDCEWDAGQGVIPGTCE